MSLMNGEDYPHPGQIAAVTVVPKNWQTEIDEWTGRRKFAQIYLRKGMTFAQTQIYLLKIAQKHKYVKNKIKKM